MARVRYIEREEAAPEALEVYNELESMGGKVLNPFKTVAHSPRLLKHWWRMMYTLVYELKFDAKLRELALLRIFKLTGCDYCFAEHDRIARRVKVPEEQIYNINDYAAHPAFNEVERLVLRYADMITKENKVNDAIFEELRQHFDEQEIMEMTFCIGNWNGLARFIAPMGIDFEPGARK
ncbi:carboxymuconolactone decarboxylase family protein [Candidatus Sumerlaeota bacterium]|nr:carboxymuconolactone decarboxylase family protein [Candidatus Sumerlaeota bacterium]